MTLSPCDHAEEIRPKTVYRLKRIRPIYEECAVLEDSPKYLGKKIVNAAEVSDMFSFLRQETKEHFICLHLDSKNHILCFEVVSIGSQTAAIVHPREVFKSALLSSASAVLFMHNHPSGDPTPSCEDIELTSRLRECAELLGIRVLDHVILGNNRYTSFADRGLL